ncbi:MAG: YraN family protein [Acidobacteria bacterium]|nr:YraN family protein [Acidobacteriota bacterium]
MPGLQQRTLLWLEQLASTLGRQPSQPKHLRVGERGEDAAFWHLQRHGYTVVARRWRWAGVPGGDIDLIAWQGPTLCFIEVKTRSKRDLVPAEFAVDDTKQRMLRRLASAYIRHFPDKVRDSIVIRFDVVSVYLNETACELMEGAF